MFRASYIRSLKVLLLICLSSLFIRSTTPQDPMLGIVFSGKASYYGIRFHGKKTANGEIMNKNDLTCAHKTLPFGTMLEVTNKANNKSVVVRVNDRGPYSGIRIIDISVEAAKTIEMIEQGITTVDVMIVGRKGKVLIERDNNFFNFKKLDFFGKITDEEIVKKDK